MPQPFHSRIALVSKAILFALCLPHYGHADPGHGIAMAGDPALMPGFESLPYADPEAPQGGQITLGEAGGFDSLNPYILKGTAPWGIRTHMVESLMGRSYDEPFTLYGLLAESVEVAPDRSWVAFTLREEARFSNGDPVTVEDVIWSFETLGEQGHPRYRNSWTKVAEIAATGPRTVRITFDGADRELPLILGLRPILRKADFEARDFTESGLEPLTGSGPYLIESFEPDRYITFRKNPDYWGRDLGLKAGQDNFERVRYDYFRDTGVMFEAFKAGALDVWRETNAQRWEDSYDFPRIADGRVVRTVIPHRRPSGMSGFVFNTRREMFSDWQVREALTMAFNYEFINETMNSGRFPRITSYFSNSDLGMEPGPAAGAVAELLAPFADALPPGAVEGYELPVSDGTSRNRRNLRAAAKLLDSAGWTVRDGVRRNAQGEPLAFTVLLTNGARDHEAMANLWRDALERLGVEMRIELTDQVQYRERLNDYDYDMIHRLWALSLSPGNEQTLYWGSQGVSQPGTRNYMGVASPAVDAMIAALLSAESRPGFVAAARALDRVLTAGRYVVPTWFQPDSLLAHDAGLRHPDRLPIYGDWAGFLPEVWWRAPE